MFTTAAKKFVKRHDPSATVAEALNASISVFANRRRGRSLAAMLLAGLGLLEKSELPLLSVFKPMYYNGCNPEPSLA